MPLVDVICDRCGRTVHGLEVKGYGTGGFYRAGGDWEKYMREGEEIICDDCMHHEPKYRAAYHLDDPPASPLIAA